MQPKKPILDEIRAIRDDFARKHRYDVRRMVESLQEDEKASTHRKLVSHPPKRTKVVKKAS